MQCVMCCMPWRVSPCCSCSSSCCLAPPPSSPSSTSEVAASATAAAFAAARVMRLSILAILFASTSASFCQALCAQLKFSTAVQSRSCTHTRIHNAGHSGGYCAASGKWKHQRSAALATAAVQEHLQRQWNEHAAAAAAKLAKAGVEWWRSGGCSSCAGMANTVR
jgi:hypothetical protein